MLVSDFDFELPPDRIAQLPLADRAASRLLHLQRNPEAIADRAFRDFPGLLREDDLLVFNNTRVFPARLFGRRSGAHAQALSPRNPATREFLQGKVEALLNRQVTEWEWEALVRPGRKIGVGEVLTFPHEGEPRLRAQVIARGEFGERTLRFDPVPDFFACLEQIGHVPLPPYISRDDTPADHERYQTVFAHETGSAAAPTAGLHFTPEILETLRSRGIKTAEVTLHVGLGTFQPLHNDVVEQNHLHRENFSLSAGAARQVNEALRAGRRVVAVGTTTVRVLEFCAHQAAEHGSTGLSPGSGEVDLFIYPGFKFRAVGAMLTNFHLPRSSLLMLVSAFAGRERVLSAYRHAVATGYRFFSYGDCMFVE